MSKESDFDIDWAAIVDLLASEYGWTIDYIINNLDLGQVISLKDKIRARYASQNGDVSADMETVPSDKVDIGYFEKLGKKHVRDDGVTEILI